MLRAHCYVLAVLGALLVCCEDVSPRDVASHDSGNDANGERELWNGVDLTEWDGNPSFWRVEGDSIVGSGPSGSLGVPTYLIFRGSVPDDFVLTAELSVGSGGNSGIQYRSSVVDRATWL